MTKPLGHKAYGSIPHLPNSRLGRGDHHCHEGQSNICCIKKRDKHDTIIVTEKLDGSCVSVAKIDDKIFALGRAGYPIETSPYEHLRNFSDFVKKNKERFYDSLENNQRFVGEWMNVATGTLYELKHEPFVIFDLITEQKRHTFKEMLLKSGMGDFVTPHIISYGDSISVEDALNKLGSFGKHGATEIIEGAVWRVERKNKFDFLAKYVRHEKIDGKYLPNLHNNTDYTFNINLEKYI